MILTATAIGDTIAHQFVVTAIHTDGVTAQDSQGRVRTFPGSVHCVTLPATVHVTTCSTHHIPACPFGCKTGE